MQNFENDIDELIGKYLAGESTAEETAFIEQWKDRNDINSQYFNQIKVIFEKASAVEELQEFDADAAWNRLRTKLKDDPKVRTLPQRNSGFSFLRIAASVIVVLGVGFLLYRTVLSGRSDSVEVVADQKTKIDTLPDGSNVFLNKQTKLAYEYDKKKKTHKVKLRGEAYFTINHEDNKKFLVEAEGIYVRDIGTSFNVTAYPESNTVEVIVIEGEVEFFTDSNPGIRLKANGKGVYDKTTKTFSIEQPETNTLAYKTKFFSFSDSDLGSVIDALNRVYDKKIVIGDSLKTCRVTVSFNEEDITEIAAVLAETLNLSVQESATEIVLEGQGCEAQ
ncbi:MAG TPA: FecR domain-containing protein [Ohtaekwangia sp.]